ncbi:nucleoside 2-deoxyribosyltransferase [Acetobacter cibinongensis]|uniref:Nucleoside 2-deoxyribosyltransferase n=1 Tax=Acetobacter cibinongensis TaxID=146475 RepID=A0A0D6N6K4_9PROT|nr:nucleoside 2-deoxyribosyltransferase [Acetobacter cibinongensis]GAN61667.1 nucleoside 2-deoxyribosyltransferase [Acetobacter cibinongensis]GBQ19411.1 nucleoside 2-deoxyribosyltransferase [Acetobacter cibinongensis NRIC 0482]GEL59861.1 nucleoside 2-deoxyribosyltransferase [Acetobacter cibinongensis]
MTETKAYPKIYLGGDLVFRKNAQALFHTFKEICLTVRLHGVSPFDGQDEVEALPAGKDTSLLIARLDRGLMDECDGALFCIDPFRRAADMDPGTAVEIGYMAAQNKPMAGYTVDGRSYHDKVQAYFERGWKESLSAVHQASGKTRWLDADSMIVHSEGLLQNAMVEGFIRQSGGDIAVAEDIVEAFRVAAQTLSALMHKGAGETE